MYISYCTELLIREKDEPKWHNGLLLRDGVEVLILKDRQILFAPGACVRQEKAKAEKERFSRRNIRKEHKQHKTKQKYRQWFH